MSEPKDPTQALSDDPVTRCRQLESYVCQLLELYGQMADYHQKTATAIRTMIKGADGLFEPNQPAPRDFKQ